MPSCKHLDRNEISIGLKGVVYSFSNTIESACKHLIGLNPETERTVHVFHNNHTGTKEITCVLSKRLPSHSTDSNHERLRG